MKAFQLAAIATPIKGVCIINSKIIDNERHTYSRYWPLDENNKLTIPREDLHLLTKEISSYGVSDTSDYLIIRIEE